MLENINESSLQDLLGDFEEENKTDNIIDGDDDGSVEIIEPKKTNQAVEEDSNSIEVITEIEGLEETEDEDDSENSNEEETQSGDQFSYKAFLSHLKDQGLVEFEDKEDLTDDVEIVYESVKKTIQSGIDSYKESIPDEGRMFLEYLEKGGDPKKYIESVSVPLDIASLDLDSEADQERVLREYLKTQDYTSAEIDETINDYKDSLLLDKQSKVAAKKLEKTFEKRTELLLKEQEAQAEYAREQYNANINMISNTIDSSDNLAGLELTKSEKDTFRKYLLVRDKDGLTAYERELQEDPVKTSLELAYLKFKKYDFASAKKAGETQANKNLIWKLKNNEQTIKGGKSSEEVKQESNLDAFKSFIPKRKN